jgi:hypothetical protein
MKILLSFLTIFLISSVSILGQNANLVIQDGASLGLVGNSTGTTHVVMNNANWVNNNSSAFVRGASTVSLTGSSNQNITGTATSTFHNLSVNKSTATVTLGAPAKVANDLVMQAGNISTTATNILEVGTDVSTLGSINWTSGSIVGPVKRWFAAATNSTQASGIFPVGKAGQNRYAQVNFTAAPAAGGYIIAEYKTGLPTVGYNGLPATFNGQLILNYENEGYWDITPYSSANVAYGALNSSNYDLKMRGFQLTSVNDISMLRIIKSPGPSHTSWSSTGLGTHVTPIGSTSDFTITNTAMNGFSWYNIGSDNTNPLPVQLQNFTAICEEGRVNIAWTSLTEINNSHYILEKSHDGSAWLKVEEVMGAGNSNSPNGYQIYDQQPISDVSYYRLTQVDYNGDMDMLGELSVVCSATAQPVTVEVYPNPADETFTVEVNTGNQTGTGFLSLTDLQGRPILMRKATFDSGINYFYFNRNQITSGTYFIYIEMEGIPLSVSHIVLK